MLSITNTNSLDPSYRYGFVKIADNSSASENKSSDSQADPKTRPGPEKSIDVSLARNGLRQEYTEKESKLKQHYTKKRERLEQKYALAKQELQTEYRQEFIKLSVYV